MTSPLPRYNGFDYLRAIMSICVVVWHMYSEWFRDQFRSGVTLGGLFGYQIVLLAVPVFILMGNYLFIAHTPNRDYLRQRVKKMMSLYCFWIASNLLFFEGIQGVIEMLPSHPGGWAFFVMSGANTIYHFFFGYAVTLVVAYLFRHASSLVVGFLLLLSAGGISICALWESQFAVTRIANICNPMNFVPYSFLAILIHRHRDWLLKRFRLLTMTLFIGIALFAAFEWSFISSLSNDAHLPIYGRLSQFCATVWIVLLAMRVRTPSGGIIRYMSQRSLSLYCLHAFFYPPLKSYVDREPLLLFPATMGAILLSYLASHLLEPFLSRSMLGLSVLPRSVSPAQESEQSGEQCRPDNRPDDRKVVAAQIDRE